MKLQASQPAPGFPRIVSVGLSGILINFSDVLTEQANRAALAFRAHLDALGLPGVTETATSLTSTFVGYDPLIVSQTALRAALETLVASQNWEQGPLPRDRRLWQIPATFCDPEHGPQLSEAADLAGLSPSSAIEELCAAPLRVMTLGFAPGQPYLGSLPAHWDIPRQTGLTKQVPVGAITVAIRQIVLFSIPSPTGWRQVGQCAFRAFRPESDTPFALRPGDEVAFFAVEPDRLQELAAQDGSGNGGATWSVLT